MLNPEACRVRAAEAERLASLVSYERDRVRLQRQAQEWRERAAELEAAAPAGVDPVVPAERLTERVRRWLRAGGRRR